MVLDMAYKTTTLDGFVTLQRGYDLPAQDRAHGNIPVIAASGQVGFHNFPKVTTQSVVLGRSGSIGNPQLITEPFWPLNTTLFVKDFHGNLPSFVYYVLKTIDFKSFDAGGTVPTLNRNHLTQIKVPLVDALRQKVIGEVLGNLDSKIAANSAISRTLEEIARSFFKSWFIDFDPVKAKMVREAPVGMDAKTAGLFPDLMEEHGAVRVPAGWGLESLGNLDLILESGSRPKGGVKGFLEGVPSIGAESIQGIGVFDYSKTKYVPQEFFRGLRRGVPQDFDVLLYKDGGKPGVFRPRVGMFGRGFPFHEYAINEHVFFLRSGRLGQFFLYFLISSESVLDVLRERGAKAAIPGINQVDVKSLVTVVPPREVLDRFDEIAAPLVVKILELSKESNLLGLIRDELLPRLISGELKIPEEMLVA